MQKWQYLRDQVADLEELDAKAQHWGTLGWELVSVCYIYDAGNYAAGEEKQPLPSWILFLKRPAMME
jgi:hypothetical protein